MAKALREDPRSSEAVLKFLVDDQAMKLTNEFTNPKDRERIQPFLIDGVSPLTTNANPTGQKGLYPLTPPIPGQLMEFQIRPSENMKFPSRTMASTLIENRTKPPKTVLILPDEPKDIYYVVTLLERKLKTDREFESS
jgi:hypothetical protein